MRKASFDFGLTDAGLRLVENIGVNAIRGSSRAADFYSDMARTGLRHGAAPELFPNQILPQYRWVLPAAHPLGMYDHDTGIIAGTALRKHIYDPINARFPGLQGDPGDTLKLLIDNSGDPKLKTIQSPLIRNLVRGARREAEGTPLHPWVQTLLKRTGSAEKPTNQFAKAIAAGAVKDSLMSVMHGNLAGAPMSGAVGAAKSVPLAMLLHGFEHDRQHAFAAAKALTAMLGTSRSLKGRALTAATKYVSPDLWEVAAAGGDVRKLLWGAYRNALTNPELRKQFGPEDFKIMKRLLKEHIREVGNPLKAVTPRTLLKEIAVGTKKDFLDPALAAAAPVTTPVVSWLRPLLDKFRMRAGQTVVPRLAQLAGSVAKL